MKIKHQLIILGSLSLMAILAVLASSTYFARHAENLSSAMTQLGKLEVTLLNLRRNEKDFLLRKDDKYLDKFTQNVALFLDQKRQLDQTLSESGVNLPNQLEQELASYRDTFTRLVTAYKQLGLSHQSGLLGQFMTELDKQIMSQPSIALVELERAVLSGSELTLVPTGIAYLDQISAEVLAQRSTIGFKYNQGLLGDTRSRSHSIETDFEAFNQTMVAALDEAVESLTTIKWTISVGLILAIIALITTILRSIGRDVDLLQTTISRIAQNNDLTHRVSVKGNNEMASIGQAVNSLIDSFKHLIADTQQQSSQLKNSSASMSAELQNVVEQLHNQSDHTNSMATAVQQMVTTIDEISQTTHHAADVVNQASSNSVQSRQFVDDTVSNIQSLSAVLAESNNEIRSLNDHVGKIGGAVHIIQDIAEQTNLLALNAAIEAARAGEQGRGFAVVADEVRALASRTHQSTEEITNLVSAIQSQMTTVVDDIEQCNTQGAETLSASAKLDTALQQISDDMTRIQSNSEQIAAAIEEQGIVMNQVGESITDLNQISTDNMNNATACIEEVQKVSNQTQHMDKAISVFKI
ncbi:methyl-accepting chemotaxis protein [Vibrio sp. SCSIO 43140]|uniref:methyl-accepting chemotaxis protein n=1 Tax=Vibrio sp. SCSIO 43140 TaxID=2819100 RepID=UPI002075E7EF|nr:methyl-accepting chemotaxis protein [Vibrio sp. SCSIO 43140]USD63711.1 methyl-accepting chemotaxis protein [Vibrio sp. SCSIO 43140]